MSEGHQRRYERKDVDLLPRIRPATTPEYYQAPCTNLSLGGLFLETEEPPRPGTLVKIECQVGDGGGTFGGVGVVAWQRAQAEDASPGIGIRFVRLDPGSAAVIGRVLGSPQGDPRAQPASGAKELKDRLQRRRRKVRMEEQPTGGAPDARWAGAASPAHEATPALRLDEGATSALDVEPVRVPMRRGTTLWVAAAVVVAAAGALLAAGSLGAGEPGIDVTPADQVPSRAPADPAPEPPPAAAAPEAPRAPDPASAQPTPGAEPALAADPPEAEEVAAPEPEATPELPRAKQRKRRVRRVQRGSSDATRAASEVSAEPAQQTPPAGQEPTNPAQAEPVAEPPRAPQDTPEAELPPPLEPEVAPVPAELAAPPAPEQP